MTDFFTADLHLGHDSVARMRGFTRTRDHDEAVLDNLRGALRLKDRLFILGDLTQGKAEDEEESLRLIFHATQAVHGNVHLITGNHDSVHPFRSTAFKRLPNFHRAFDTVQNSATLKIAGERAIMSHFPYDGDSGASDRYEQHRMRDVRATIIHGHTHSTEPVSYSRRGTLQICVSLDAWNMAPVSKETLTELIKERKK
ncbi:MAG: metallophosphoesterase family protein [Alphaproteobacteria bacterium]|nr:metallophosphoesterase family protein [Alphaproteobacteria bacterium]